MDKSLAPALELDKTSLQFRVGFNPPTARRFADLGTAHGICPRDLRNMIREIDGLLPRMDYGNLNGKPNPNNGRAFHTYAIGKEYSRALYLSAPKLYAKGFNFDFDGDAMSVHVPISEKAVHEAYQMLPSKNLFKAGDKAHMINIDPDYQMGLYYLSLLEKSTGLSFRDIEDAEKKNLIKTDVFTLNGKKMTLGQYEINEILPAELRDYGRELDSKTVKKLLEKVSQKTTW